MQYIYILNYFVIWKENFILWPHGLSTASLDQNANEEDTEMHISGQGEETNAKAR